MYIIYIHLLYIIRYHTNYCMVSLCDVYNLYTHSDIIYIRTHLHTQPGCSLNSLNLFFPKTVFHKRYSRPQMLRAVEQTQGVFWFLFFIFSKKKYSIPQMLRAVEHALGFQLSSDRDRVTGLFFFPFPLFLKSIRYHRWVSAFFFFFPTAIASLPFFLSFFFSLSLFF